MKFRCFWMMNPNNSKYFKPQSIPVTLVDDLTRVDQCFAGNQWEKSLNVIEEIQNRNPEGIPAEISAYVQYLQGICYNQLAFLKNAGENLTKAIRCLEAALPVYDDKNKLIEPAIILNELGVSYRALAGHIENGKADLISKANNSFQTAQKLLEKALQSSNSTQSPMDYLCIVQNLGNTGNALAESQDAPNYFDEVVDIGRATKKIVSDGSASPEPFPLIYGIIQYNTGYALNALAGIRSQNELNEQALTAFQEALQQYPVNQFPMEHIHILNQMAGIYIDMAEVSGLEEQLNEAVKISKIVLEALTSQMNYPMGYALILYNLGRSCQLYGRIRNRKEDYHSKACKYLETILQIPDLSPVSKILAATYLDLGMIYQEMALRHEPDIYFPKAVHAFTEATSRYSENEYSPQYISALTHLGETHYQIFKSDHGSFSEAERLKHLELAQTTLEETVRLPGSEKSSALFQQNRFKLANIALDLAKLSHQKEPLEKAIQSLKTLLEIIDPNAQPFDYAQYQITLGDSYLLKAELDDDPVNVNRAIEIYETVLKIYTPDLFPLEYATTTGKIGAAYREFARAQNKESNLSKAINHFQNALKYCPSEKYPLNNALINQELGYTLLEMAELNHKNYYSLAAQALESALKVFTLEKYPAKFAEIQITLGHSHLNIYRVEEAENYLTKARNAFEAALNHYTYEHFPYHFASIMNDLGITLDLMAKASKPLEFQNQSAYLKFVTDRLTNSIGAYEAALTVFCFNDYPEDYAQVQFNLGLTYSFWAGIQNKSDNAAKAIRAFEEALKVYTPETHPVLNRQVNIQLEKEKQRVR